MGISRAILLDEAYAVLERPLNERGYILEELPPGGVEDLSAGRWEFSFEKQPATIEDMYYVIQFSPDGFSDADLFDLSVTLYRSTFRDPYRPPPGGMTAFRGNLGMYFLDRKESSLQRWHFVTVEQVRTEYLDILDRLTRFGIPLLENPLCTLEHWLGRKPLPSYPHDL